MGSMGLGSSGKATCKKDSYLLVVCWCSDERGWARNVPWSRPGRERLGMFIWETHLFFQLVQVLFVSQGAADLVEDIWPGEGDGFSGFGQLSGSCRVQ